MPLPRVHRVVQDSLGNVVPQVQCSVYNQGTGVLATLWQDDAGTIPLSNPMISSTNYGSIDFYVVPGHFDLAFVKPGYSFETLLDMQVPQDDLTLGTMAQQDANNVVITGGSVTGLSALSTGLGGHVGIMTPPDGPGGAQLRVDGDAGINRDMFVSRNLSVTGTAVLASNLLVSGTSQMTNNLGMYTAPAANIVIDIRYSKASRYGIVLQPSDSDTGTATAMSFNNLAGTPVGSISTTGAATAYSTTSDARLKEAVEPLTGALDVVRQLNPVAFLWKADGSPGRGLLAGEVQEVIPDGVITGERGAIDDEGRIVPQMIDYSKLVPYLIGAVKELTQQVEMLQAQLAAAASA